MTPTPNTCPRPRLHRAWRAASALLLACAALLAATSTARASAEIVWEGGGNQRRFACDTDAGAETLLAIFSTPDTFEVDEMEAVIDYCSGTQPFPDWWNFGAAPRLGVLSVDLLPPTLTAPTLVDYWQGRAGAPTLEWTQTGINMARIVVHVAMPPGTGARVVPGSDYFAFRLNIAHTGTTQTMDCGVGVCLVLNDLRFLGPGVDYRQHYPGQGMTAWQDGVPGCPFIVPVAATTWGGLKALYR